MEISKRVEKFIQDYTRNCSNELCAVEDKYGKKVISYHEWLTPEQALSAVAIEREEVIEKACKWLEMNTCVFKSVEEVDMFKDLFKKAMGEQV